MSTVRPLCDILSDMNPPAFYSRLSPTASTRGGSLPHWAQQCATFVTFRLVDSLPEAKWRAFASERDEWLAAHPEPRDRAATEEYAELFPRRLQKWLDAGYGSCALRSDACRRAVEDALRHFDGVRYSLYAFVVMPNHVHVLYMPEAGFDGRRIVRDWKQYSAHEINRLRGESGRVWQKESYDHLVRDVGEFNACRSYICNNDVSLAFDACAS